MPPLIRFEAYQNALICFIINAFLVALEEQFLEQCVLFKNLRYTSVDVSIFLLFKFFILIDSRAGQKCRNY